MVRTLVILGVSIIVVYGLIENFAPGQQRHDQVVAVLLGIVVAGFFMGKAK